MDTPGLGDAANGQNHQHDQDIIQRLIQETRSINFHAVCIVIKGNRTDPDQIREAERYAYAKYQCLIADTDRRNLFVCFTRSNHRDSSEYQEILKTLDFIVDMDHVFTLEHSPYEYANKDNNSDQLLGIYNKNKDTLGKLSDKVRFCDEVIISGRNIKQKMAMFLENIGEFSIQRDALIFENAALSQKAKIIQSGSSAVDMNVTKFIITEDQANNSHGIICFLCFQTCATIFTMLVRPDFYTEEGGMKGQISSKKKDTCDQCTCGVSNHFIYNKKIEPKLVNYYLQRSQPNNRAKLLDSIKKTQEEIKREIENSQKSIKRAFTYYSILAGVSNQVNYQSYISNNLIEIELSRRLDRHFLWEHLQELKPQNESLLEEIRNEKIIIFENEDNPTPYPPIIQANKSLIIFFSCYLLGGGTFGYLIL